MLLDSPFVVAIKEYYPFDYGDRDASMSVLLVGGEPLLLQLLTP